MSEAKFTKGKWVAEKLGPLAPQPTWRVFSYNSRGEVLDVIVDVFGGEQITKDDEESQANANLIAAAPNLYDMIIALFCNPDGEPCFEGSEGDREYMRQVLKKARGEV